MANEGFDCESSDFWDPDSRWIFTGTKRHQFLSWLEGKPPSRKWTDFNALGEKTVTPAPANSHSPSLSLLTIQQPTRKSSTTHHAPTPTPAPANSGARNRLQDHHGEQPTGENSATPTSSTQHDHPSSATGNQTGCAFLGHLSPLLQAKHNLGGSWICCFVSYIAFVEHAPRNAFRTQQKNRPPNQTRRGRDPKTKVEDFFRWPPILSPPCKRTEHGKAPASLMMSRRRGAWKQTN